MQLQQRDDADVITLGDGQNMFNAQSTTALANLVTSLEPSATPLVLVGTGKYWSTGLDLEWMQSHRDHADRVIEDVHRVAGLLMLLSRPTVAAINGHAIGAGAMIALACDHRVMADDGAYLRFPEVDLALAPTRAMTNLMIARLGRSVSAELLLTGRRYASREALEMSVVDRCVPSDQLLDAAIDLAQRYAGKDPRTVGAIKRRLWGDVAGALLDASGNPPSTRSGL